MTTDQANELKLLIQNATIAHVKVMEHNIPVYYSEWIDSTNKLRRYIDSLVN